MRFLLLLLFAVISTVYSKLTCTRCPFHITPKGRTNCTETCEGDVCMIVVNKYFNGTIIAGCINLHGDDKFHEGPAACYREEHRTLCACTTKDRCNDPTSPIANFKFVDAPILSGYQFTPLVGGPPGGEAIDPSKLIGGDAEKSNETNGSAMEGVLMTTPQPLELTGTRMSPHDVVVTKTVSLQIGDGEVTQQHYSTVSPSNGHQSPLSEAQGTAHGNKTSGSTTYIMPLAMVVGSVTMIIASLLVF